MSKTLFIVQKADGARVISAGVLTRIITSKLVEANVVFKRKDVVEYAAGMVDGLNGRAIPENVFEEEMNLAVSVFREYANINLLGFRNMILQLNEYNQMRNQAEAEAEHKTDIVEGA